VLRMFRFLFRLIVVLLTARFVYLFARHLSGGGSPRLEKRPERPLVNRSTAIDVPFTEERPGPSTP